MESWIQSDLLISTGLQGIYMGTTLNTRPKKHKHGHGCKHRHGYKTQKFPKEKDTDTAEKYFFIC